jgi:SAM-dependent methyltransferase
MTGAADWSARVGDNWAAEWRRTDRSFGALGAALVEAVAGAAPQRGRVLDIGCGAGATALAVAAARPDLDIVGVDLSPALIAVARGRAAAMPPGTAGPSSGRVAFEVADAAMPGEGAGFDAMMSRHGLMFFADPLSALARLRDRMRAGGRLMFTCFAERTANRWAVDPVLAMGAMSGPPGAMADGPGPFAFAVAGEVADLLDGAGWAEVETRRIAYAWRAGAGTTRDEAIDDALSFLSRIGPAASLLATMAGNDRELACAALREACAERTEATSDVHGTSTGTGTGFVVDFPAAAWLWSARNPGGGVAA